MSRVYTNTSSGTSIYIGGKADAKDLEWLEKQSIKYILNVTPQKEAGVKAGVPNFFQSTNKFTYKRIAVYDNGSSNLLEYADSIASYISSGLIHGSVLVHCQRGASRSSTSVLIYLMRKAGYSLTKALRMIRRERPQVEPIPAFLSQLKVYEERCEKLGVITTTKKRKSQAAGADTMKKAAIGPTMPPIGPSLPPTAPVADKTEGNAAIGPAMPPVEPSLPPIAQEESAKKKTAIGHSMPLASIGPSLPLPEESDRTKEQAVAKDAIGPALPEYLRK